MARSLDQLLNEDMNKLAMENPSIASTFMAILDHAGERAKKIGTDAVYSESITCNPEGHVSGHLTYGKR